MFALHATGFVVRARTVRVLGVRADCVLAAPRLGRNEIDAALPVDFTQGRDLQSALFSVVHFVPFVDVITTVYTMVDWQVNPEVYTLVRKFKKEG